MSENTEKLVDRYKISESQLIDRNSVIKFDFKV